MNVMRKTDNDTLAFSWKEWLGLAGIALAPALTLTGTLIIAAIKLEGRLTKIETNGANTVSAIQSLDLKWEQIQAMNSEINVLQAKLEMMQKQVDDFDDKNP